MLNLSNSSGILQLEKLLTGFKGDPIMDPPEPEPFPDPSDGELAVGVLTPFVCLLMCLCAFTDQHTRSSLSNIY